MDAAQARVACCCFTCFQPPVPRCLIHRYTKLMMRRIDWSTAPLHAPRGPGGAAGGPNGDVAMGDGEDEEDEDSRPPNVCTLVGGGLVGFGAALSGLRGLSRASGAWYGWAAVGTGGERGL